MPSRLFVGGNIACAQAKKSVPDIITVITKTELSRNSATFRDGEELLSDIAASAVKAVTEPGALRYLSLPATMEKSYKRMEDAEKYYCRLCSCGIECDYLSDPILGKDAHTVVSRINSVEEMIKTI